VGDDSLDSIADDDGACVLLELMLLLLQDKGSRVFLPIHLVVHFIRVNDFELRTVLSNIRRLCSVSEGKTPHLSRGAIERGSQILL